VRGAAPREDRNRCFGDLCAVAKHQPRGALNDPIRPIRTIVAGRRRAPAPALAFPVVIFSAQTRPDLCVSQVKRGLPLKIAQSFPLVYAARP
jgi:hypothetical protein